MLIYTLRQYKNIFIIGSIYSSSNSLNLQRLQYKTFLDYVIFIFSDMMPHLFPFLATMYSEKDWIQTFF